jgi:hypothetical protein
LPARLLCRRADAVAVIGRALEESAAGAGHRKVAGLPGRPVSTVRGWLRALARNAGRARERHGPDPAQVSQQRAERLHVHVLPAPGGPPRTQETRGGVLGERRQARGNEMPAQLRGQPQLHESRQRRVPEPGELSRITGSVGLQRAGEPDA